MFFVKPSFEFFSGLPTTLALSVDGKTRWSADASPLLQGLEQACACTPNPKFASFHPEGNLALQFAPAGRQSGSFHDVSGRWIVIQGEQK